MKKLLICLLMGLICNSTLAQIRKTTWGDSKVAVKKSEAAAPDKEENNKLYYFTTVSNLPAVLIYSFNNNKLAQVAYIIDKKYVNANNHIKDYESLKKQLTTKYGTPGLDKQEWSNSLYKNDPEKYGLAVSTGYLTYSSFWKKQDISISLYLRGENYECVLSVIYQSDKFFTDAPDVDPGL